MKRMSDEEKVWWSELADRYDRLAANPKKCKYKSDWIMYSCIVLEEEYGRFMYETSRDLYVYAGYLDSSFPLGRISDEGYRQRQSAFLTDMADFIRENIGEEA